jgi:catechol-2,3-dioxygenase
VSNEKVEVGKVRLLKVEMTVSDLGAGTAFYEQTLELPVTPLSGGADVTIGASTLTLTSGSSGTGSHHLAMNVAPAHFAEAKAWLAERTPLLSRHGADEFALPAPWHSRSVYFTGPDGVVLELIARRNLPSHPTAPFTSADLTISEIGIAVDDVDTATAAIEDVFGLTRFDQGGPGFAPVGDDNGLLIVVSASCTWFPTAGLRPSTAPLTVILDSGSPAPRSPLVLNDCTLRDGT